MKKKLSINIPTELHDRFLELFPYRGELTAFVNRCMEAAVESQNTRSAIESVDDIVEAVKRES